MRRIRKLLLTSLVCAGVVMVLLFSAVMVAHLMANRALVHEALTAMAARAAGAELDYDRLDVSLLPIPHLEVIQMRLARKGAFAVRAARLSAYPAILPALTGQVRIRRLVLETPNIRILQPKPAADESGAAATGSVADSLRPPADLLAASFGILAEVTPGTRWHIQNGRVTLVPVDAPNLIVDAVDATLTNTDERVAVVLSARSSLADSIRLEAWADVADKRVQGTLNVGRFNPRQLILYTALPAGIAVGDTRASLNVRFTIDGPQTAEARLKAAMPQLVVTRNDRRLSLAEPQFEGALRYDGQALTLAMDTITTRRPALALSATATLSRESQTSQPHLTLQAGTKQLDIAVAADVTRAIAGDLKAIRTAFGVAREGRLTDAAFTAVMRRGAGRWTIDRMAAAGHLKDGRVSIPGIDTDLEEMHGDVSWADTHVDFNAVGGHFAGVRVDGLSAAIDWADTPTLTIDTPSARVDAAIFYPWLTGFKGLSRLKSTVHTIEGRATLSRISIDGPLKDPRQWTITAAGSPEALRLTSAHLPSAVELNGGEIVYSPTEEYSRDVQIRFLDGTFSVSHQSRGIAPPTALTCRLDGRMGPDTVDWLGTHLPIPEHLLVKPPVDLEGIQLAWNGGKNLTVNGALKTAGGVHLDGEVALSDQGWQLRGLHFADGHSEATVSVAGHGTVLDLIFAGRVEKETVDNLLDNNRTLSGSVSGDFQSRIDLAAPFRSTFTGEVSGSGLHLHTLATSPVDMHRFAVSGSGAQITIVSSQLAVGSSLAAITGTVASSAGHPTFDLHVDADRIDAMLLHRLFSRPSPETESATAKPASPRPRGTIALKADRFTVGDFTWAPLAADIAADGRDVHVQVKRAALCGISTTGWIRFSPDGTSLHIIPAASEASLQETADCLLPNPVTAQATFAVSGEIRLPPTRTDITRALSGELTVSSDNGRIVYSSVLMKIFSVLNVTEAFTGGKSDLAEDGYGYTRAFARAAISDGKARLNELLLDGNSLKITGQGEIDMAQRKVDVTLLAAPLKTVDRIIDKIPIINYITGGTLVSVPLRVHGDIKDPSVVPLAPSAVGKSLLNFMGRTLNAPFRLVKSAADLVTGKTDTSAAASNGSTEAAPQP